MRKESPANGPGGVPAGERRGAPSHCLWGPRGLPASPDWVPSCSVDAALCLCMGRTTFRKGGGGAGTRQGGLPTHLHPRPRPDYIHSLHTHTLAHGEKERAAVTLWVARQYSGTEKKTTRHFKQPNPCFFAGFLLLLFVIQKLSLVTGLSRPLSASWLAMRLRLRFSLERSLSKTSPERRAETRSSNSPPSSPLCFAFLNLRSRSRCSFSYVAWGGGGGKETSHSHEGGCGVPNTHVVTPKPMKQELFPALVLNTWELVRVIDTPHGLRSTAPWLLLVAHSSSQAASALLYVLASRSHQPKVVS